MRKNRRKEEQEVKNLTAKEAFETVALGAIERGGIEDLLAWLENETDFYTAPASTRYHGSYEGGLVDHSLNVYAQMVREAENFEVNFGLKPAEDFDPESLAIIALFHDLCKVNTYEIYLRNVKDEVSGKWYQEENYRYGKNVFEMGHGAKSLYYVQRFMKLTDLEAQAIFWHMGAFDTSNYMTYNGLGSAYSSNEYAFLIQRADYSVTYIIENEMGIYAEADLEKDEEINEEKQAEEVPEKEVVEEKPKPRKRRRGKAVKNEDEEDGQNEETAASASAKKEEDGDTDKPGKSRRTRRSRKGTVKDDEGDTESVASSDGESDGSDEVDKPKQRRRKSRRNEETEEDTSEKGNRIRRPRRGKAAKTEEVLEEEPEEEQPEHSVEEQVEGETEQVDETTEETDDGGLVLEEDFFWKNLETGEVGVWREGELLPDEYDEDVFEPLTEEEYEELKKPKAVQKGRPRSRRRK